MSRRTRLRAFMLLLAVALSAAPALAGGYGLARAPREVRGIFTSLWQTLEGFLPALTKGRQTIDPNGGTTDGRAGLDPNGATDDGRQTIDPDGTTNDGRAGLDPDG